MARILNEELELYQKFYDWYCKKVIKEKLMLPSDPYYLLFNRYENCKSIIKDRFENNMSHRELADKYKTNMNNVCYAIEEFISAAKAEETRLKKEAEELEAKKREEEYEEKRRILNEKRKDKNYYPDLLEKNIDRYKARTACIMKRNPNSMEEKKFNIVCDRFRYNITYKKLGDKYGLSKGRIGMIVQDGCRILENLERFKRDWWSTEPKDDGPITEESSIEKINPPVRVYNALKRRGINTIGDVLKLSCEDLLEIRNLGYKSIEWLKEELNNKGFHLKIFHEDVYDPESWKYRKVITSGTKIKSIRGIRTGMLTTYWYTPIEANDIIHKNIETLGDLAHLSESDVLSIEGVGPKSVKVLKEHLEEAGLEFANDSYLRRSYLVNGAMGYPTVKDLATKFMPMQEFLKVIKLCYNGNINFDKANLYFHNPSDINNSVWKLYPRKTLDRTSNVTITYYASLERSSSIGSRYCMMSMQRVTNYEHNVILTEEQLNNSYVCECNIKDGEITLHITTYDFIFRR